jgi:hypothetical protein
MKPTKEYYLAKADLCFNLFLLQFREKGKDKEALKNFTRYKVALHNAELAERGN